MADYSIIAANCIASVNAIPFSALGAFSLNPVGNLPNPTIAGAAITQCQPIYQGTDGLFYPADANGADPLYKVIAVSINAASAGQPVALIIYDPNFQPGCTLAIGDVPIVSGNVGRICPSSDMASGWFVSTLGVAYSTTKMVLRILRSDVAR